MMAVENFHNSAQHRLLLTVPFRQDCGALIYTLQIILILILSVNGWRLLRGRMTRLGRDSAKSPQPQSLPGSRAGSPTNNLEGGRTHSGLHKRGILRLIQPWNISNWFYLGFWQYFCDSFMKLNDCHESVLFSLSFTWALFLLWFTVGSSLTLIIAEPFAYP